MARVFANGPGDLGSILGRVILKTPKMVLDASSLKTHHYKVRIKGKVKLIMGKEMRLPLHLRVVAIEKGAFESPSTPVTNFTTFYLFCVLIKRLFTLGEFFAPALTIGFSYNLSVSKSQRLSRSI